MKINGLDDLLKHTEPGENGCLEWIRARDRKGYGSYNNGGRTATAHRMSATFAHGPAPEGAVAMHSCDNPSCVNPDHLSWGTPKQNMSDAALRGRLKGRRHVAGEDHPSTPLTVADVRKIRERRSSGEIYRTIASDFGIGIAAVARIAQRQTWREVG